MTKHEITIDTYLTESFEYQQEGHLPIEVNYNKVISFIEKITDLMLTISCTWQALPRTVSTWLMLPQHYNTQHRRPD